MKTIPSARRVHLYLYLLLCNLMFVAATNAQAGWLDSAKKLIIEATEPIGLCVIVIGGMRISTKDLYGGIAAVVGGIFIFKAQDIIAGLK